MKLFSRIFFSIMNSAMVDVALQVGPVNAVLWGNLGFEDLRDFNNELAMVYYDSLELRQRKTAIKAEGGPTVAAACLQTVLTVKKPTTILRIRLMSSTL
jgi:hypothetical protein